MTTLEGIVFITILIGIVLNRFEIIDLREKIEKLEGKK
jgi:hypothetical protein